MTADLTDLEALVAEISDDAARYRAAQFAFQFHDGHQQHYQERVSTSVRVAKVVIRGLNRVLKPFRDLHFRREVGIHEPGQLLPEFVAGTGHQSSPSQVGSTASVGDGPVTGGDPAGPGHPQGGAS